jgi:hypothetical protein
MRRMSITLLFFFLALGKGNAEANDLCTQQIPFQGIASRQPFAKMAREVSRLLNASFVAEIEDGTEVEVPSSSTNLDTLLSSVNLGLHCSSVDNVIHVVAAGVANQDGNLLNHKFSYFEIPADVDHFSLTLHARLDDEGFDTSGERRLIKSGSGYIPADASSYPLKAEELHGITARDLILKVASQEVITCVIEFPKGDTVKQPKSVWNFAEQHWQWTRTAR